MNSRVSVAILASVLASSAGCAFLDDLLGVNLTAVRLVNNGDFDVRAVLYFDDDQEIPREVLTEIGTRMEFTLAPGESASVIRDCDLIQAIVIDNAELMVIGQVGPETDTEVLRDGDDFGCGDTIVLTFDHGPLLTDFNISVAVER
ncbi:MAG: hypothetical protein HRF50_00505 [Phycisphaerae bacterium]